MCAYRAISELLCCKWNYNKRASGFWKARDIQMRMEAYR